MLVDALAGQSAGAIYRHPAAIEVGRVVGSTDPRPQQFMHQENVLKGACSQSRGISARFCAVSVPLKPERQFQRSIAIIKIVMFQRLLNSL
jgi:hypothetical protein